MYPCDFRANAGGAGEWAPAQVISPGVRNVTEAEGEHQSSQSAFLMCLVAPAPGSESTDVMRPLISPFSRPDTCGC